LQDIWHKTFLAKKFVENNYSQRNYLPIKTLKKSSKNKYYFAKFYNKFTSKIPWNI